MDGVFFKPALCSNWATHTQKNHRRFTDKLVGELYSLVFTGDRFTFATGLSVRYVVVDHRMYFLHMSVHSRESEAVACTVQHRGRHVD